MKRNLAANKKRNRQANTDSSHQGRAKLIAQQVFDIANPLCEAEGIELVFVEFQSEASGKVLRIFIDRPEGITLDDCTSVSHQLNDLLDVTLENIGAYSLEVTSPGPERPIGKRSDFDRFKGNKIKIQTLQPINGQKNFTGLLAGTIDEMVTLTIDDKTVAIPFSNVNKARLVDHGDYRCT